MCVEGRRRSHARERKRRRARRHIVRSAGTQTRRGARARSGREKKKRGRRATVRRESTWSHGATREHVELHVHVHVHVEAWRRVAHARARACACARLRACACVWACVCALSHLRDVGEDNRNEACARKLAAVERGVQIDRVGRAAVRDDHSVSKRGRGRGAITARAASRRHRGDRVDRLVAATEDRRRERRGAMGARRLRRCARALARADRPAVARRGRQTAIRPTPIR